MHESVRKTNVKLLVYVLLICECIHNAFRAKPFASKKELQASEMWIPLVEYGAEVAVTEASAEGFCAMCGTYFENMKHTAKLCEPPHIYI